MVKTLVMQGWESGISLNSGPLELILGHAWFRLFKSNCGSFSGPLMSFNEQTCIMTSLPKNRCVLVFFFFFIRVVRRDLAACMLPTRSTTLRWWRRQVQVKGRSPRYPSSMRGGRWRRPLATPHPGARWGRWLSFWVSWCCLCCS